MNVPLLFSALLCALWSGAMFSVLQDVRAAKLPSRDAVQTAALALLAALASATFVILAAIYRDL